MLQFLMARGGGSGGKTLVLVAMTLANAMILIDQTAVPLALPDVAHDLRVSAQSVQWVLNASLLPLAGLTILGGRLGDILGRRKVFLAGSILFAGASAVAGLAPSFTVLLVARVASAYGYFATFVATSILAVIGMVATAPLVRKPVQPRVTATEYRPATS